MKEWVLVTQVQAHVSKAKHLSHLSIPKLEAKLFCGILETISTQTCAVIALFFLMFLPSFRFHGFCLQPFASYFVKHLETPCRISLFAHMTCSAFRDNTPFLWRALFPWLLSSEHRWRAQSIPLRNMDVLWGSSKMRWVCVRVECENWASLQVWFPCV